MQYLAKMVSAVVNNALTTVDTCTQVTITDHNFRDMLLLLLFPNK